MSIVENAPLHFSIRAVELYLHRFGWNTGISYAMVKLSQNSDKMARE